MVRTTRPLRISSGQGALEFATGVAATLAYMRSDVETRIAGLVFELTLLDPAQAPLVEPRFGSEVGDLVAGVRQLIRLRELTQSQAPAQSATGGPARGRNAAQQAVARL